MRNIRDVGREEALASVEARSPNSAFFKMTLMSVEGHSIPPAKGPGGWGRSRSPSRKRAQGG